MRRKQGKIGMSLSKYDRICRYEWELTAVARTAITRMLMPFSRMLRKSDRDPGA